MDSSLRIAILSTRLAGTDGVSLETGKWEMVLQRMGHECVYFCGESDRPAERSYIVPEAHFRHPTIQAVNQAVFSSPARTPELSRQVEEVKVFFKDHLYRFTRQFQPQALIVENALAIPMNIPLGLAITEFIAETGFPVIAHHHDFYWERERFLNSSAQDYLEAAFPPDLPSIRHVVINSVQAGQLASRLGLPAVVIPNVMDFDSPPAQADSYAATLREELGIAPGSLLLLQPTRIIPRKGIERAIELVQRLGLPGELVISHAAGDEGLAYAEYLKELASALGVTVHFAAEIVGPVRGIDASGRKVYTLADLYSQADLVTYPSLIEGFGNAFLEAVYYKRPLIVNRYPIYDADIRPKGFRVIEFEGTITEQVLEETRNCLAHPERAREDCEVNYALAQRYFSISTLEQALRSLLEDMLRERR